MKRQRRVLRLLLGLAVFGAGLGAAGLVAGDEENDAPRAASVAELQALVLGAAPTPASVERLRANGPRVLAALEGAARAAAAGDEVLHVLEYALALRRLSRRLVVDLEPLVRGDLCLEARVESVEPAGPRAYRLALRDAVRFHGEEGTELPDAVTAFTDLRAAPEAGVPGLAARRVVFALEYTPPVWVAYARAHWVATGREPQLFAAARPLFLRDAEGLLRALDSDDEQERWLATVRILLNSRLLNAATAPWVDLRTLEWDELRRQRPGIREGLGRIASQLVWDDEAGGWVRRAPR